LPKVLLWLVFEGLISSAPWLFCLFESPTGDQINNPPTTQWRIHRRCSACPPTF